MSSWIVILTIVFYFGLLYLVSYITGRKADNQGFFVGNRKSPWYVVAFAMIGTSISGVTFISVPGWVQSNSFSYIQMVLGFIMGYVAIAYILIPLYYRMNLVSIYEYLENRFGFASYKTGAWFFFLSKMLGAAVRMFLVASVLQLLVFDAMGVPFAINVMFTIGLIWLYTFRGGVKSLIWTDTLQTFALLASVILCIYYIASDMGLSFSGVINTVADSDYSRVFFFDDLNDKRNFFKQFLAGVFTTIAMTGLDQDMMQKNLSCKNIRDAQKNVLSCGVSMLPVNLLFLSLGVLLYTYAIHKGLTLPAKSDNLFPMIATGGHFPQIVGILFVLGLISAAYSSAGSALTALTTSFTVDVLGSTRKKTDSEVTAIRKKVHLAMSVIMGLVIIVFEMLNNTSVIDAVYILASYTYGPILGMFLFGILTNWQVKDRFIPLVALLSPALCYLLSINSEAWFNGYQFSYELLLFNAFFTCAGCFFLRKKKES
ncbi:MAG: sodium:solute symporter [Bacteroidales bacterium]